MMDNFESNHPKEAMPTTYLSANLRLLCSYKSSIAEVARALNLNRSQLNKYLNGTSQPRAGLLRRIGDHFGVELHELLMPNSSFSELLRTRKLDPELGTRKLVLTVQRLMTQSDARLQTLAGNYYEYYQSMSSPSSVLCSLVMFEIRDGSMCYKRVERILDLKSLSRKHFTYHGAALMLGERIFMTDYEENHQIELTQTILYPDYVKSHAKLFGIKLGVSANRQRMPCAARVFLERVPSHTTLRAQLRRCGLYTSGSPSLPPLVFAAVDNRQSGQHFHAYLDT
jgi:transcriptional regulator with XRE-family HTH domain